MNTIAPKMIGIFLLLGIFLTTVSQAQTNKAALLELQQKFEKRYELQKQEAIEFAKKNNLPVSGTTSEGSFYEIQKVVNGIPWYYATENLGAAFTTRANTLWKGGSLNLELDGEGYNQLGEWDGGGVLTSHQEFSMDGSSRVTQMDASSSTHYHSTHVAGTMIATGIKLEAHGMANKANLKAYDWNSDEAEMASAGANGLEISNHSYGLITGWRYDSGEWTWYGDASVSPTEDYRFGFYDEGCRDYDQIAYNAKNYLIAKSAGNDRGDGPSNAGTGGQPEVDGGDDGYDCIGSKGNAKNVLTVGAVNEVENYTGPSSVVMSSFSSWGPTDDGRIKPDIVAKGVSVYSALDGDDADYGSLNGTSMATPNASGTMVLLQKLYQNLNGGTPMLSSTLKALVIHTADEAGSHTGPDYKFGWGLMNAYEAATIITHNQLDESITEIALNNGDSYEKEIITDGSEPIRVTIVWTDVPGTPLSPSLDPEDPILVNDLNLLVAGNGESFYPYSLDKENPANAATAEGPNHVDNVEQVFIAEPTAGTYTITVDHDGSLTNIKQWFSIIISGDQTPTLPMADFKTDKVEIYPGDSIQFTDLSIGDPTSWEWTFTNGSPELYTGQNPPSVIYNEAGIQEVSLTVTNAQGSHTETRSTYITVKEIPGKYPPSNFTAAVNETNVNLSWNEPSLGTVSDLIYDNDTYSNKINFPGYTMAVRMSPEEPCRLLTLSYYTKSNGPDLSFKASIYNWGEDAPTDVLVHSQESSIALDGWVEVDVSDANILVSDDFIAGFEFLNDNANIAFDDSDNGRAWIYQNNTSWVQWNKTLLIRAMVLYPDGSLKEISSTTANRGIVGFNIYRDDLKINPEPVIELNYTDESLEEGSYIYYAKSVYEDGESMASNSDTVTVIVDYLSVSPDSLEVLSDQATATTELGCNTTWELSEDIEWLSVSPESGDGNTSLTITLEENIPISPRTGVISFTSGDLETMLTLIQEGGDPYLEIDVDSVSMPYTESTFDINVSSNIDWTIVEESDWLAPAANMGSENQMVTFTVDYNDGEERNHTVTFIGGEIEKELFVKQLLNSIGVPENGSEMLAVYPNPVSNSLYIKSGSNKHGSCTISLFNALGDIVYTNTFELNQSASHIDISKFQKGIYYLNAEFDDTIFRKKIIKLN